MTKAPQIGFMKMHSDAVIPQLATAGSAGADLRAMIVDDHGMIRPEGLVIEPFTRVLIGTGLSMDIPSGYEVQLRPRSGLALKFGFTLANAPATIDQDFKGEVMIIGTVIGTEPFRINHLDRIAQMVVAPVCGFIPKLVDSVGESARGSGGFGSTGI